MLEITELNIIPMINVLNICPNFLSFHLCSCISHVDILGIQHAQDFHKSGPLCGFGFVVALANCNRIELFIVFPISLRILPREYVSLAGATG